MNGERVLTAVLALCCLFALGTASAMLGPSVSTTPDDVIDVDYASLPLPTDQAERLKSQFQDPSGRSATTQRSAPSESGDRRGRRSQPDSAADRQSADEVGDGSGRTSRGGNDGEREGSGSRPDRPSLLDRLLALLRALLSVLLGAVPWLLLLAAVAVAAAFGDRIAAALRPFLPRSGRGEGESDGADDRPPAPANEVERAWFEMVERLDLAEDRSRTAGQVARRAVEAGVDPVVVARLTRTFQDVRYGGEPVTDRRVERAREGLRQFRAQYGGDA